MGYRFTLDDVRFLRSRHGEEALEELAALALTPETMLTDVAEARSRYAPHDAALVETVTCRRRAAARLRFGARGLFTEEALQQATTSIVAARRAGEIARRFSGAVVHDVTCSIGAELVELAAQPGISAVLGSDLDRVRLAMAAHNVAPGPGRPPTLLVADALAPTSTADVVLADPGRRTGSSRVFRLDQLTPPLLDVLMVYAGRPLVVKCAPGLDHLLLRDRFGFVGEVQLVSLNGGVREACLWSGPGVAERRRATVLRTDAAGGLTGYEITDETPDTIVTAGAPGEFLIDPDGAVVRAGLVRHYAHRHGLWQLDPQIAYLTGPAIPAGERGFRIVERLPGTGEKALRKALAAHDCGSLEILARGLDTDPDVLRKRLRLSGTQPMALVLTRIGRKGVAFLCEPGVRGSG
ncbi:MAG: class I SAM-dependent methyltransferase [Gordonia sp. (in: high G+C Gram-positive bacteria)]